MELKNSLLIVQRKIIEDYTDIQSGTPSYMVIRNKPVASQLDSFVTYALDNDYTIQKSFKKAKEDFLRNSIYGYIGGHTVDGDYIIKVVDDTLEDKSPFIIEEEDFVVNVETSTGTQYANVKGYRMKLK